VIDTGNCYISIHVEVIDNEGLEFKFLLLLFVVSYFYLASDMLSMSH
jgi:hypothetical protein